MRDGIPVDASWCSCPGGPVVSFGCPLDACEVSELADMGGLLMRFVTDRYGSLLGHGFCARTSCPVVSGMGEGMCLIWSFTGRGVPGARSLLSSSGIPEETGAGR